MDMEVHPLDQDVPPTQKGTVLDDHDMQRMGKIQELKVCGLCSAERCPPPLIEGPLPQFSHSLTSEICDRWLP